MNLSNLSPESRAAFDAKYRPQGMAEPVVQRSKEPVGRGYVYAAGILLVIGGLGVIYLAARLVGLML